MTTRDNPKKTNKKREDRAVKDRPSILNSALRTGKESRIHNEGGLSAKRLEYFGSGLAGST